MVFALHSGSSCTRLAKAMYFDHSFIVRFIRVFCTLYMAIVLLYENLCKHPVSLQFHVQENHFWCRVALPGRSFGLAKNSAEDKSEGQREGAA